MTTSDVRTAHKLLDRVSQGRAVLEEEISLLRSFLPELPAQKTLEEITELVNEAWSFTHVNEWDDDAYGSLDSWLSDLEMQLRGLADTEPTRPEFLQTGAEYQEAPWGTIVAMEDSLIAWVKKDDSWSSTDGERRTDSQFLWGVPRKVLRWGENA